MEKPTDILNFGAQHTTTGRAYISAYNFPKNFISHDAFIGGKLKGKYCGGFGALIYADYATSEIGPYKELIFIPGKFDVDGECRYAATKIYVSTPAAINTAGDGYFGPKEVATFKEEQLSDTLMHLSVHKGRNRVISVEIATWSGIHFPLSTNVVSFPMLQMLRGEERLLWQYEGECTATMARIESVLVRPALFPDVAAFSPLASFYFESFSLNFKPQPIEEKK